MTAIPFYQVPIDEWPAHQQWAVERLHLKMIGLTHTLLLRFLDHVRASLEDERYRYDDGRLSIQGLNVVQRLAGLEWKAIMRQWRLSFEAARWEAAYLGLATLARLHHYYFVELAQEDGEEQPTQAQPADSAQERGRANACLGNQLSNLPGVWDWEDNGIDGRARLEEQSIPPWIDKGWPLGRPVPWLGDLDAILRALEQRILSDGFNLSHRVWRLDQASLIGIQNTLLQGFGQGKTVWDIAQALEKYLGAGQECPRWTEERLKLTPAQIAAGDETGLIRGDACAGQGVAYRALRLAVTELQFALHAVLREVHTASPQVTGERLYLNDLHTEVYGCECEAITGYPPNMVSDVLPVGTVILPLHPWCMCYLLPELMPAKDWGKRWDDWASGETPWPELDEYLRKIGLDLPVDPRTGRPGGLPLTPPAGPLFPGDKKWLWWLLLLILAEAYRRWSQADKAETDAALEWDADEWDEWDE